MRNFLKRESIMLLLIALPFILVLIKWSDFPDPMPVHYNIEGDADRFGSKWMGLFLLPGINLVMYVLLLIVPNIDPQKTNFAKFADKYRIMRIVTHAFMAFIFTLVAAASLGYNFNFPLIVMYSVVLLFLIFGNYMRTIRHNYFVGIRTPWTLANEKVWTQTHRFTAGLWVAASLVMLGWLPFAKRLHYPLTIYLITLGVIPIIYSYLVFQKVVREDG